MIRLIFCPFMKVPEWLEKQEKSCDESKLGSVRFASIGCVIIKNDSAFVYPIFGNTTMTFSNADKIKLRGYPEGKEVVHHNGIFTDGEFCLLLVVIAICFI